MLSKTIFNKINLYSWINLGSKLFVPILILPMLFTRYSKQDSEEWLYFLNLMSLSVFFDFGSISLQNRIYGYIQDKGLFFSYIFNSKFNSILFISSFFWYILLLIYLFVAGKGFNFLICFGLCSNYMAIYVQNIIFSNGYIIQSKNVESLMNIVRLIILLTLVYLNIEMTLLLNFYYSYFILLFFVYVLLLKKLKKDYSFVLESPFNLIKKYYFQMGSAWIATGFSSGMFYISNIALVDFYKDYQWSNYLFTMRLIDMIVNISFVPFYSRIPNFINKYYKNKKIELKVELRKSLILSICLYAFVSISAYFAIRILFRYINTSTNIIGIKNLLCISLAMLLFKIGACFLQISAFGNIVKWHIAILIQFLIISFVFIFIDDKNVEYSFSIPFLVSQVFFVPYSYYLAKKNF